MPLPSIIIISGERLKPIPNYENYYASHLGNIWSMRPGRPPYRLKPVLNKALNIWMVTVYGSKYYHRPGHGYCRKPRPRSVHTLVMAAWSRKPKTPGDWTVHHKDMNRANNQIWPPNKANICWLLRGDNVKQWIKDCPDCRKLMSRPGTKNPMSKLRERDIPQIMKLAPLLSASKIGLIFGVAASTIDRVIDGTGWRHVDRTAKTLVIKK